MRRNIILIFSAFCASMLMMSCHQPEAPEYYGFQDLQIGPVSGQQTTLSTVLKFYNPNTFSLQLRKAELDVKLNGKPAGHSVLDSTILIPRKDTFYVPVAMQVNMQGLLGNALAVLLERKVTVTLDGRVHLKRGMISFSRPFHYEGKEDISALLEGRY
jgi:LEA14-like dessication related protein